MGFRPQGIEDNKKADECGLSESILNETMPY